MSADTTQQLSRFFVGGLGVSISDADLRDHFSRYGTLLEARVQRDKADISKGFGWIRFDQPCPQVLQQDHVIAGTRVTVAKPDSCTRGVQHVRPDSARFFVGNLNYQTRDEDLRSFFSSFGTLTEARVMAGKGFGWIRFSKPCPEVMNETLVLHGNALNLEVPSDEAGQSRRQPQAEQRRRSRSRSRDSRSRRRQRSRRRSSTPQRHRSPRELPGDSSDKRRRGEDKHHSSDPYYININDGGLAASGIRRVVPEGSAVAHGAASRYIQPPPAPQPLSPLQPSFTGVPGSSVARETFVCIPISICPIELVRDPNSIIANIDRETLLASAPRLSSVYGGGSTYHQ